MNPMASKLVRRSARSATGAPTGLPEGVDQGACPIGVRMGPRPAVFVAQALLPAASTFVSRPVFASGRVSTLQTTSLRHGPSSRRPLDLTPVGARPTRGSALIAVLWLVAALSAIAFTVASTVRSEVGRVSNATDGLKAYYLATGAIERAMLYLQWGPAYRNPDGSSRYYNGGPVMQLEFPTGRAVVELIPETSKLNVNGAPPEELYALGVALGAGPLRAREIALGIVDWRTPQLDPSDQLSLPGASSFGSHHASFQEIEELLSVRGMTPELFYGTYERDPQGGLVRRHGLGDCLSVYGSAGAVDVNTADPAVLAAVGVPPDMVSSIVGQRRQAPILRMEQLTAIAQGLPGTERLTIGGNSIFTIRATAQNRLADGTLSDTRRSVAALLKLLDRSKFSDPYCVLRWYDQVWVE